jgi:hypothetical protein
MSCCQFKVIVFSISRLFHITSTSNIYPFKSFAMVVMNQFCGGEILEQSVKRSKFNYLNFRVKTIIDSSTEDKVTDKDRNDALNDKITIIEQLGKESNATDYIHFIPLKCTSLICPQLLERITNQINKLSLSSSKSININQLELNKSDMESFHHALDRFRQVCYVAQKTKLSLLLDAEQSYRQPAIEFIARILSQEFNTRSGASA